MGKIVCRRTFVTNLQPVRFNERDGGGDEYNTALGVAIPLIAMVLRGPPSSKFVGFEQHRNRLLFGGRRKKNSVRNE